MNVKEKGSLCENEDKAKEYKRRNFTRMIEYERDRKTAYINKLV